jgi:hypothetical protein
MDLVHISEVKCVLFSFLRRFFELKTAESFVEGVHSFLVLKFILRLGGLSLTDSFLPTYLLSGQLFFLKVVELACSPGIMIPPSFVKVPTR